MSPLQYCSMCACIQALPELHGGRGPQPLGGAQEAHTQATLPTALQLHPGNRMSC